MTRRLAPAALLALTALLASCTSSAPAAECFPVPPDIPFTLVDDSSSGPALLSTDSAAVRAPERADAYLVAVRFMVDGETEPRVGVWMTTNIDANASSMVASVNDSAQALTVWPGEINGERLTADEAGVTDAIACLDR